MDNVYMVYYTDYYYYVDSVWDNWDDAQARADALNEDRNGNYANKDIEHFAVQTVTLNKAGDASGF